MIRSLISTTIYCRVESMATMLLVNSQFSWKYCCINNTNKYKPTTTCIYQPTYLLSHYLCNFLNNLLSIGSDIIVMTEYMYLHIHRNKYLRRYTKSLTSWNNTYMQFVKFRWRKEGILYSSSSTIKFEHIYFVFR